MGDFTIRNDSSQAVTYEINGPGTSKTVTVAAHASYRENVDDHYAGLAVIAMHNGVPGEQAELTFGGFNGQDFFDASNIMGAGDNMTVQATGDSSTLKGDPLFMQDLNAAYKAAPQDVKDKVKGSMTFDSNGEVTNVGVVKGNPDLEKFIRSFADGKTYIGVGSWNGNNGVASDNNQSSSSGSSHSATIVTTDSTGTPASGPQGTPTAGPVTPGPTTPAPVVPGSGATCTSHGARPATYTLQPGDNFWTIANQFGCSVDDLVRANPDLMKLYRPWAVPPGTVITIPQ